MSFLSGTIGLCQTQKSEMSIYGRKNVLCELQSALLQAGDEGEDSSGHAVFRTENAFLSSGAGGMASGVQRERKIMYKVK